MSNNVIKFPGDEPPTADEDPHLEAIALHTNALSACRDILEQFSDDDQLMILSGLLGGALCEYGTHPGRSLAISMLGKTIDGILSRINQAYDNGGQFR